jgi:hypothetical protein
VERGRELSYLGPWNTQALYLSNQTADAVTNPFIAGCGKTILTSTIVEHIKKNCEPESGLAYYYFDFNDTQKQGAENFLSSLIGQLCSKTDKVPDQLKELYKKCNDGREKPPIQELELLLPIVAKGLNYSYIIVDALDECPKGLERETLLKLIKNIMSLSLSNLHLLVTSRLEPDINDVLSPLLTIPTVSVQGSAVQSDIELYIHEQLTTNSRLSKWANHIKADIEHTLLEGANGMYKNLVL